MHGPWRIRFKAEFRHYLEGGPPELSETLALSK